MQPVDPTTSNSSPPALHLIGAACLLRLSRGPLQHRVELFCLQSVERARVYGRATTRDHSMLLQFNSCMKPDGQLERHTVFFPVLGKHRVVVQGNGLIEVVQIAHGRIHVENRSTDPHNRKFPAFLYRGKLAFLAAGSAAVGHPDQTTATAYRSGSSQI
jgi:hypothetical protein